MKVNTTSLAILASLCAVLLGIKINKNTMQAPELSANTKTQPTAPRVQKELKESEDFDEHFSASVFRVNHHLTTAPAPPIFQVNTDNGLLRFETPSDANSAEFGTSFSW